MREYPFYCPICFTLMIGRVCSNPLCIFKLKPSFIEEQLRADAERAKEGEDGKN
jgi:hypothetical protein